MHAGRSQTNYPREGLFEKLYYWPDQVAECAFKMTTVTKRGYEQGDHSPGCDSPPQKIRPRHLGGSEKKKIRKEAYERLNELA